MTSSSTKYLVTVDRDCRSLFAIDRETSRCEVVSHIEQRLDKVLEKALSDDARKWNRGLKTICQVSDGYVLCDIFGVYRLNHALQIMRYLSLPRFTDIHSAIPYGDHLLISNTGVDQVLWVDWEGNILQSIDLHQWYPATPWMDHDLSIIREHGGGDLRLMPLDWTRESCHVNWAEETPLGTMLSCFIQGEIIFFKDGRPSHKIQAGRKCHAPRFLAETRTILYAASEDNRIVEIDLDGREVWSMEGFKFAKHAQRLPSGNLIVADTGNQRIAEVDPRKREIIWECPVPGTPYDVELWHHPEDGEHD